MRLYWNRFRPETGYAVIAKYDRLGEGGRGDISLLSTYWKLTVVAHQNIKSQFTHSIQSIPSSVPPLQTKLHHYAIHSVKHLHWHKLNALPSIPTFLSLLQINRVIRFSSYMLQSYTPPLTQGKPKILSGYLYYITLWHKDTTYYDKYI